MDHLRIQCPKLDRRSSTGWNAFFPYYAGFSSEFTTTLVRSANLARNAVLFDPWNGSGTTTYTAARLGINSVGVDLNPVMVIVAKARLLVRSEIDALEPLAQQLIQAASTETPTVISDDPLLQWMGPSTAAEIRSIEQAIRKTVVGSRTISAARLDLNNLSCLAAVYYVAMFAVCRALTGAFRCSNPTWLRLPRESERRISARRSVIHRAFENEVASMCLALSKSELPPSQQPTINIVTGDSSVSLPFDDNTIDMMVTSPPYCTRIDYTGATRIELALISPLVKIRSADLALKMLGSTKVPAHSIGALRDWGPTCNKFLDCVSNHKSKASGGYYLRTHLDYFDKLFSSLRNISRALKPKGLGVAVVQDSFYKDIHNDLPQIFTEMSAEVGMRLTRRTSFTLARTMANVNSRSRKYDRPTTAIESVLCFEKE